jgi:hypothetical protein
MRNKTTNSINQKVKSPSLREGLGWAFSMDYQNKTNQINQINYEHLFFNVSVGIYQSTGK